MPMLKSSATYAGEQRLCRNFGDEVKAMGGPPTIMETNRFVVTSLNDSTRLRRAPSALRRPFQVCRGGRRHFGTEENTQK